MAVAAWCVCSGGLCGTQLAILAAFNEIQGRAETRHALLRLQAAFQVSIVDWLTSQQVHVGSDSILLQHRGL
jgi:hypothetical protein